MKTLKKIGRFLLGIVITVPLLLTWIVTLMIVLALFMKLGGSGWGAAIIELSIAFTALVGTVAIFSNSNKIVEAFLEFFKRTPKKKDEQTDKS